MRTTSPLVIVLTIFFAFLGSVVIAQDGRSCEVTATLDIQNSSGQNYGKASVNVQHGQSPYKYIFYDNNTGKQLQKDLSKNSIDNLKKGAYYCIVADNRGCIKKIQFQIQ